MDSLIHLLLLTAKPPMGTPAYKTPEEYYDQILELKKVYKFPWYYNFENWDPCVI
jgi:hypothetical protein